MIWLSESGVWASRLKAPAREGWRYQFQTGGRLELAPAPWGPESFYRLGGPRDFDLSSEGQVE